MNTYRDLNIRVETSALTEFTHDLIFWPVDGSIQHLYVQGVRARTDEEAQRMAYDYAATNYSLILDSITAERLAVTRADRLLHQQLDLMDED